MSGGGAILAKTGQRVTIREAEIAATIGERPEVAALAEAGPSRASSAVAAAVAAEAATAADMDEASEDETGKVEADHLRKPVVKNTTKAQRNRPRANTTKKKATPKVEAAKSSKKSPKKCGCSSLQTFEPE